MPMCSYIPDSHCYYTRKIVTHLTKIQLQAYSPHLEWESCLWIIRLDLLYYKSNYGLLIAK